MKSIKCVLLIFILIFFITVHSYSNIFDNLSSAEKDKYVHFTSGVIISHTSYPFFKKYLTKKGNAWLYSFSLAFLASLGKEIYDINRTGFNCSDLLAGALGGITIVVVTF